MALQIPVADRLQILVSATPEDESSLIIGKMVSSAETRVSALKTTVPKVRYCSSQGWILQCLRLDTVIPKAGHCSIQGGTLHDTNSKRLPTKEECEVIPSYIPPRSHQNNPFG